MSNDFSQYDQSHQYDNAPQRSEPRKSGCGKGCLIAFVILGILTALFVGGLLWIGHTVAKGLTNDPTEILGRLKQHFPTAQLPEGYRGIFGLKFDIWLEMDLMIFGADDAEVEETGEVKSGNSLMLFSIKAPGMKPEQLEDGMHVSNNGGKVIEKKPYPVRVGNYEFEGYLQKVLRHGDDENRKVYAQLLIHLGNSTMLVMQGDQDKIDETALRQFLATIAKDCPNAKRLNPNAPQK